MKTHFYTEDHAVTLLANYIDIPSMLGYGTEPASQILMISVPMGMGVEPTIEIVKLSKVKEIYKELKSRQERIAVWSFIKRYENNF